MKAWGEKIAPVTGASKGIGAGIAKALAAAGAAVVVNYALAKWTPIRWFRRSRNPVAVPLPGRR